MKNKLVVCLNELTGSDADTCGDNKISALTRY